MMYAAVEILIVIALLLIYAFAELIRRIFQRNAVPISGGAEDDHLLREFAQIPKGIPYKPGGGVRNKHNGQVKLFITELEFLTHCLNSADDQAIVVYAGSAPSNKISYLSELFPGVKFVLVDPNEHYVKFGDESQYSENHIDDFLYFRLGVGNGPGYQMRKSDNRDPVCNVYNLGHVNRNDNITISDLPSDLSHVITSTDHKFYIIEDYMTDDLCTLLRSTEALPMYFISDIRRDNKAHGSPTDIDICRDSALMYNWVKILQPAKFMLKFRCPWPITDKSVARFNKELTPEISREFARCEDIDFIGNYRKKQFIFCKPTIGIWLQAFAPRESAETRLVGDKLETMEFNVQDYENKMAYFNRFRSTVNVMRPITASFDGFNQRNDCALVIDVFNDYIKKYGSHGDAVMMFKKLLSTIGRGIS